MAQLIMAMGGRAADRLIYNEATSGANQDLKQATRIARLMVTQFGMSPARAGRIPHRRGTRLPWQGDRRARDFSEGTAQIIDEEVQRLLREADERAAELLEKNRDKLDILVEALLQREELLREEMEELLGGLKQKTPESPNGEVEVAPREPEAPPRTAPAV